ncbi:family 1 glycosylhydrolase [Methylobacterium sp. R2-1]|uniref:family 1 glycosylhydrolase n=1 Tax=Methylobacterium sp. R2-1 TaxID=2587064 RepID=UPI00160716FA|nr:family 1 glycosylhydrolase [Methylobacterium sp. R2-1]MBB2960962.1 dTDP-4-dehydrorhamnose reductase [Methylobacterium sp. R2-1]
MLELWGGIECSVVRIRDRFRDQVAETGHRDRPEDLDAVARLGIRTLRFPILWESIAPDDPDTCDWSWHDARLARLDRLGIRPIAGLTHHGSGPRYTSLLDPAYPDLLARHARRVAERCPQIRDFTPVNEPLTTARFSGLYGHWFPHHRDEASFLRMVVNQCRATQEAMRAIRTVRPDARLIQTEDIGRTFSTPLLAEQAEYENGRRWLSLDLLCGRVDRSHPWFVRLLAHGIDSRILDALRDEAAPDLIGVNHYLTSERYLDQKSKTYPPWLRGGNGRRRYADAEAVRIPHLTGLTGPRARLAEVWERYGRPLAVTEVHHGCTRDEQLRWFAEVWEAAGALNQAGVPVQAVTLWSLFGAVDWNSLLLRRDGHYEPGAYDIRAPRPRLTALGRAAQELTASGRMSHPVLASPGWWRRPERAYLPEPTEPAPRPALDASVIVLEGAGAYGGVIAGLCEGRGMATLQIEASALPEALVQARPWAVIDATSLPRAATAKRFPGGSFRADIRMGEAVARLCARAGLPLLAFSSDLVFDGREERPACESDPVRPSGLYGASEAEREARILGAHPLALIVRTSAVFGLPEGDDAAGRLLASPDGAGGRLCVGREIVSPAYLPDFAHAALDLLVDGETGIWHLTHPEAVTWEEFARRLAAAAGLPDPVLTVLRLVDRRNTALASERGGLMPPLDCAITRFITAPRRPPAPAELAAE